MEGLVEQVVRDVLIGRKGAATRFYRTYAPRVRSYLLVKLPSKDDAEEVLQDVFLSAFDALPLFRGESSVVTWLLSIARHEAADFYRKRYVRAAVEQTGRLYEELVSEMETPEFAYAKKRLRERFNRSLDSLSDRYRRVLFLKYEMGMSVQEVARRMGVSFKAAESLLYRARMAFIAAYEAQSR